MCSKLICRKITDKIGTLISNNIPCDGALSAAVDVMSFAHDIVMINDSTIAVGSNISDKQASVFGMF